MTIQYLHDPNSIEWKEKSIEEISYQHLEP